VQIASSNNIAYRLLCGIFLGIAIIIPEVIRGETVRGGFVFGEKDSIIDSTISTLEKLP